LSLVATDGNEFARALELARDRGEFAANEERVVETLARTFGWSRTRARWFIAVNRDQLDQRGPCMLRSQAGALAVE
jgi:hypothetical protein